MSTNPYAPPNAVVADIPAEQAPEPPFFAVSISKFVVMSLCTAGLYQIYWFYRNWRCIKERDCSSIMPPMRSIFGVFYCYPCFARIRRETSETSGSKFAAGPLATGWIVFQLLSRLPDPYWLISLLAFVFVIPVQQAVNQFNAEVVPTHDRNATFTAWKWVFIVVLGLLLSLALIGAFLPEI